MTADSIKMKTQAATQCNSGFIYRQVFLSSEYNNNQISEES